ncbi:LysR family transcriptional regulator [Vibrio maritimus]|uniref:Transcriptional regulator n=2 Tax=Vibrio TaxID=662 RepID=A0ABQ0JA48_9VIBR|nr:LysR family transcriptional regulator [Vibrio maritimus]GAL20369.1 putative transcriptional regulator [Vibrio maritimus]GAL25647.1 putative transcriptional regulator [Vibrio variabilis]
MLSVEQIEAFITTVEAGSFSGAARKLGKVQSAVSQNIMNLEIDCGVELFDRRGRYPVLTEEGEKLLPYAKAAMVQHNRLTERVDSLTLKDIQPIVLTIDEGIPFDRVTPIIRTLSEEFPRLELEVLFASSNDAIEMVQTGRATSALVHEDLSIPFSLDFESIGSMQFDIYVATDHPLAKTVAPHLEILSLHRQLCISSRNSKSSNVQQALSPDIWYSDSYQMLLEWCIAGFGWTYIPSYLAKSAIEQGKIIPVPVEFEKVSAIINVSIIQHSSKSKDLGHRRLRELLKQNFQEG